MTANRQIRKDKHADKEGQTGRKGRKNRQIRKDRQSDKEGQTGR